MRQRTLKPARGWRTGLHGTLLTGVLAVACQAQDPSASIPTPVADAQDSAQAQQLDGVITRVERLDPAEAQADAPAARSGRIRVTINTAAVWRDYARDTVAERATSPDQAAAKGQQVVATRGQPRDQETLVTVEIKPDSKRELRYRAALDEASLGAATATAAEARTLAQARPPGAGPDAPGRPAGPAAGGPGASGPAADAWPVRACDPRS